MLCCNMKDRIIEFYGIKAWKLLGLLVKFKTKNDDGLFATFELCKSKYANL